MRMSRGGIPEKTSTVQHVTLFPGLLAAFARLVRRAEGRISAPGVVANGDMPDIKASRYHRSRLSRAEKHPIFNGRPRLGSILKPS